MKAKAGQGIAPAVPVIEDDFSEQVAALAYALWEARGCPEGTPEEDWYQAESLLLVEKK